MTSGQYQKRELIHKFLNLSFDIGNIENLTVKYSYDSDFNSVEIYIYDNINKSCVHRHFLVNDAKEVNKNILFLTSFLEKD